MGNDGSLPKGGQTVFDFDTQAGITHLLASIRGSEMDSAQKNELRDLVFLYSNGGRDEHVKATLEQKISAYNLQPAEKKVGKSEPQTEKAQPEKPAIGTFRGTPSFTVAPRAETKQESPQVKEEVVAPVTPAPEPLPQPSPAPAPQPAPAPEPTPAQAQPQPVPAPAEPATPKETASSQTAAPSQEASLQRIREIKALVNEKVGNPVNLVDINNEVGREYMSALLDAMKKINSGASAGSAMARLEAAYASVEETLKNKSAIKTAPQQEKTVVAEPAPQPQPQPSPAPAPQPAPAPEPTPPQPKPTPGPAPKEATSLAPKSEPAQETKSQEEAEKPNRVPIQNITDKWDKGAEPKPADVAIKSSQKRTAPEPDGPSGFENQPAPESKSAPVTSSAASASGIKPLSSLADLSKPTQDKKSPEKTAHSDELHSPEIDSGLEQLLLEWPIFKKSGLFGTGPKGRQHPLFIKMAPLQIPLLLAGRFEGATQEIKQSVTDYMNGWRYEQGLIYEQGETFEHYLRRVIKHILDLQKG